ncbi:FAD:protein FMN transferase [Nonomuraea ferruginea]|uniref:FAD:protein FMN transferase n=1 Tax=Nonomuraea ferruginea TaxID=46174 RepID=A0ABT4SSS9_9ACTN|nr:FAD:protein FMN transferase [Nonomuraea ferruginea]MDA0640053.1 FAD:protein FMN transferase [Nonomuraea ferruginea]
MTTFPGTARVGNFMGTHVSVDIRTALPTRELTPVLDHAFRWLRWVEETFDPDDEDSQIFRLNRGQTLRQVPELVEVLHRCDELSKATDGWFEARIDGRVDPSGYIKGWALERLSRALTQSGAVDHLIDAGGDIRVRGSASPGKRWRIGVRDPKTGVVRRVLFAHDLAVATSGRAEIVNPRTGERQEALSSVTVLGPDLGVADAYATAMYAMGPVLARRFGIELGEGPYQSLIVTRDGQEFGTPGLAAYSGAGTLLAG